MMDPDDRPLSDPAATLALIEAQRATAERRLNPHPIVWYGPWGTAWLLGFGLLFLRFGPDGKVFVDMPEWLPLVVLYASLVGALVVSTLFASRAFKHVRGESARQGTMYGLAWALTFAGIGTTTGVFADRLPDDLGGMLWGSVSVAAVGTMHMAGAAIWRDLMMFILGAWITVVNIAGVLAGPGWHSLLIAVLGGGGMLGTGVVLWLRSRR
jgi:hypothetical protein